MPSQKERILELLKSSPSGVTCREFSSEYLFHKLATRCGELRREGYKIEYIKSDNGPMDAKYILRGYSMGGNAFGSLVLQSEVRGDQKTVGSTPTNPKYIDKDGQSGFVFQEERFD